MSELGPTPEQSQPQEGKPLLTGWMIVAIVAIVALASLCVTALLTHGPSSNATASTTSTKPAAAGTTTTVAPTTAVVPTTTAVAPPTTAIPPATPPCSASALFALAAANGSSLSPTFVPWKTGYPVAYCNEGWAVLSNFTVQAGSGDGIAVFSLVNDAWQFAQWGDDSGENGTDCPQYPSAAVQALGGNLC